MAKSGKEIRRRIRSVKSTQQITKAMKMVAAARLRKSEGRASASRPYTDTLREVMGRLGAVAAEVDHPFLAHLTTEFNRVLLVFMTSDKGLCGSFNTHMISRAGAFIKEQAALGRQVGLICVGKKGWDWARNSGHEIVAHFPSFNEKTTFADLKPVMDLLSGQYLNQEVGEVYLLSARFINIVKNIPTVVRLLPIEALPAGEEDDGEYRHEYMLEPSPEELLASLLPSYFRTLLFQAAIENFTSENGARMVAMENATKAAGEMIEDLTLQYNKARQASITLELLDIVGGAEALKG
ncbi:ATP synthase F1 subunit gamma [bacterium]|nr:ATP synthase F1 subunit gamma [bacterium]